MKRILPLIAAVVFILAGCTNSNNDEEIAQTDTATSVVADSSLQANIATSFTKEISYGRIHFIVTSANADTANSFTLIASGYTAVNDSFVQKINGSVVDLVIDDIDRDNNPEVAVITEHGKDSARKAYVYSSNSNKSVSPVNLVMSIRNRTALFGNMGHDEYSFVENSFVHRFPLYSNGSPTGKWRQIQYKLKPGKDMKQLVQYKVVEY